MTALRSALERYLSMRQGLGYKYRHQARRLTDFVSFMETRGASPAMSRTSIWKRRCRPPGSCRA